jgi:hypothetical protein
MTTLQPLRSPRSRPDRRSDAWTRPLLVARAIAAEFPGEALLGVDQPATAD